MTFVNRLAIGPSMTRLLTSGTTIDAPTPPVPVTTMATICHAYGRTYERTRQSEREEESAGTVPRR